MDRPIEDINFDIIQRLLQKEINNNFGPSKFTSDEYVRVSYDAGDEIDG